MSAEIFSSIVHIPNARRNPMKGTPEMTALEVERMTYRLTKALDDYDETAVIGAIRSKLREIEERFDVSFQSFSVVLANNKVHNVCVSEPDNEKLDVFLEFGATQHGT